MNEQRRCSCARCDRKALASSEPPLCVAHYEIARLVWGCRRAGREPTVAAVMERLAETVRRKGGER